jgi:hypothetical protein
LENRTAGDYLLRRSTELDKSGMQEKTLPALIDRTAQVSEKISIEPGSGDPRERLIFYSPGYSP